MPAPSAQSSYFVKYTDKVGMSLCNFAEEEIKKQLVKISEAVRLCNDMCVHICDECSGLALVAGRRAASSLATSPAD